MAKGIYKRGSIYWIRYAGLDGKTVYESSRSSDFKEAQTLLTKRKRAKDEGKEPEIGKIANYTFSELAERYLLWIKGRHRSAVNMKYLIKQQIERFGALPLRRFTTLIVEQYQTDLINKKLKSNKKEETKRLKPASINKSISLLKAIFKKAVDWEMVEEDVLKRVRKVKQLPEDRRLRFISTGECRELINACEPHLRPIVITALNSGMRKGEILSLEWTNTLTSSITSLCSIRPKITKGEKFLSMRP